MAEQTGTAAEERYLVVGTVRRPHGIRGEVTVSLDTDRPGTVYRAGRVLYVGDAQGRPGAQQLTLEKVRPFKGGMLVKFRELSALDARVEALRGATLLLREAESPPLAEDEVYYHQLVGMRVVVDGREVGSIRDVLELPGSITLAVPRAGARELLIPFVAEWIRRLDVAAGVLEIDAPEGLLEL
jgi:16S rRNA processing protein RimM